MVLSTHFEEYEKGEVMRDVFQSLLGTGVFNSDGPHLSIHRPRLINLSILCAVTGDMWK